MNANQQSFFKELNEKNSETFGGTLRGKSNPKKARPISIKRSTHLVMRSSLATGSHSLLGLSRCEKIETTVRKQAKVHGVRLYRYTNAGNHLHMIVLPRSRKAFHGFIRSISGLIARITMGVEKGSQLKQKFWDARPFTRVVEWGRGFKGLCAYLEQNALEALGFIEYRPRKTRYKNTA